MSFKSFSTTMANTLSQSEQRRAYDRYIVPTPGRIYFKPALGVGNAVDFANPKPPPLLRTAASEDRLTSSMVKAMYRKHSRAPSRTDFHEFPHLGHWLIAGSGREEVADKALKLAEVNAKPVGRASNAAWIFRIIGRWCEPVDAPLYVKECKLMGHAIRQGFPVVAPTSPSLSARSVAEQDLLWGQS